MYTPTLPARVCVCVCLQSNHDRCISLNNDSAIFKCRQLDEHNGRDRLLMLSLPSAVPAIAIAIVLHKLQHTPSHLATLGPLTLASPICGSYPAPSGAY